MKKKKCVSFLAKVMITTLTVCAVFGLSANMVKAEELTTSEGFKYTVTNDEVTITGYTGDSKDVVIPNVIDGKPVTIIGSAAFGEKQLTSVVIPNSVTTIEYAAFALNKLTSITIPNGVIAIGESAFQNNELTSVIIPSGVTTISDNAFSNNKLTSVTIQNGVETIGPNAFSGNKLTGITIPESVTTIGESAFRQNQLTSVVIPSSVTTIGNNAFAYTGTSGTLVKAVILNKDAAIGRDVFLNASPDFQLFGYEGSTAKAYAIAARHTFVVYVEPTSSTQATSISLVISSNFGSSTLMAWTEVKKAMQSLTMTQLTIKADAPMTIPTLEVNIQSSEKILDKAIQDAFKGEKKGIHVHIGDGFAVTIYGQNMTQENQNIDFGYTLTDATTENGKERILAFNNNVNLGMNVILHAYLPDATPGAKAKIYTENEKGDRTLFSEFVITEQNRICWSTDSLQKFVIVY